MRSTGPAELAQGSQPVLVRQVVCTRWTSCKCIHLLTSVIAFTQYWTALLALGHPELVGFFSQPFC